jgi:hypothetical protein
MAAPAQIQLGTGPLDDGERLLLTNLLGRMSAGQAPSPGVRVGNPYQALANISIPRRGDWQRNTDLVRPGETVYLTDDEAAAINQNMRRVTRRNVDVLRPAKEAGSSPMPKLTGRVLSGPLNAPPPPPPGSDMARPDPPGSTKILITQDVAPEASEPSIGSEDAPPAEADAMDLPPGTRMEGGIETGSPEHAARSARTRRSRS